MVAPDLVGVAAVRQHKMVRLQLVVVELGSLGVKMAVVGREILVWLGLDMKEDNSTYHVVDWMVYSIFVGVPVVEVLVKDTHHHNLVLTAHAHIHTKVVSGSLKHQEDAHSLDTI